LSSDDINRVKTYALPHVKNPAQPEKMETGTHVSSIHWNQEGSCLVTSSNDQMARTWCYNEDSASI